MLNKIRKLREKKGFTLVELIVVIAIIAILTAVLVPLIGNWTQQAAYTTLQDAAQTVSNSVNNALSKVTMGGAPATIKSIEATKASGSTTSLTIKIDGNPVTYDAADNSKNASTNSKIAFEVNNILVATMSGQCAFLASIANGAVDGVVYRNDWSTGDVIASGTTIEGAGFDNAYQTAGTTHTALGVSGKFKGDVTVTISSGAVSVAAKKADS